MTIGHIIYSKEVYIPTRIIKRIDNVFIIFSISFIIIFRMVTRPIL